MSLSTKIFSRKLRKNTSFLVPGFRLETHLADLACISGLASELKLASEISSSAMKVSCLSNWHPVLQGNSRERNQKKNMRQLKKKKNRGLRCN